MLTYKTHWRMRIFILFFLYSKIAPKKTKEILSDVENNGTIDHAIVFDINGTLVRRYFFDDDEVIPEITKKDVVRRFRDHLVFFRPHLNDLCEFLEKNNIKYVFWSTMTPRNTRNYVKMLKEMGFKSFIGYYDGAYCKVGTNRGKVIAKKWVKDLRLISETYNVPLEKCVLIDDDEVKRAEGCKFIDIKEYDPAIEDTELLITIQKIREFLSISQKSETIMCEI